MPAARRRSGGALPIQRAFVVHFACERSERRRFIGRVEHLSSGQAKQFFSLAELLEFLDLAPDEGPGEGVPRRAPKCVVFVRTPRRRPA
jgi:hypothetical protein